MSNTKAKLWYVVYTKPRAEEYVQLHFHLKQLECFYPRLLLPGVSTGHRRIVPLFPNYLFVRLHLFSDYQRVIWSPGVKYIVSFSGSAASVADGVVEYLVRQADSQGVIAARSNLKPGQEVRINGGPFDGVVGLIQRPPDAKGRVGVLMKILNRQVKVEVPAYCIESGWVAFKVPAQAARKKDIGSSRSELTI